MLPFHKRPRAHSSIEITTEDLEPVELPAVRPPSVRPGSVRPAAGSPYYTPPPPRPSRPAISFSNMDDEMTVVRPDKRPSSVPPSRSDLRMPRIPPSFAPRFDDDIPTELHVSSRPLLSMSTPPSHRFVDDSPSSSGHWVPPPPPSAMRAEEPPRSAAAVDVKDPNASAGRNVDLSMTSSLSGMTDLRNMRRPSMGWAAGLVAVGVFAGLVAAFVSRGEGLSAVASLIDPSHVSADVVKAAAAPQAPAEIVAAAPALRPGAAVQAAQPVAAQPVVQATQPAQVAAPPSCAADTVTPAQPAQVVQAPVAVAAKVEAVKAEAPKPVAARPVAAPSRPVVHHVEAPAPRADVAAAERAPSPPPVAKRASRRGGDDMESASAADALAKAQLDAALSR